MIMRQSDAVAFSFCWFAIFCKKLDPFNKTENWHAIQSAALSLLYPLSLSIKRAHTPHSFTSLHIFHFNSSPSLSFSFSFSILKPTNGKGPDPVLATRPVSRTFIPSTGDTARADGVSLSLMERICSWSLQSSLSRSFQISQHRHRRHTRGRSRRNGRILHRSVKPVLFRFLWNFSDDHGTHHVTICKSPKQSIYEMKASSASSSSSNANYFFFWVAYSAGSISKNLRETLS